MGRRAYSEILSGPIQTALNLPEKEGCDYADLAKEKYEERTARHKADCSR